MKSLWPNALAVAAILWSLAVLSPAPARAQSNAYPSGSSGDNLLSAKAQLPPSQNEARKVAADMAMKFDTAYNKHDAAGVAALYAEGGTFVPARPAPGLGSVVTGRDGIEKFFAGTFNTVGSETTRIVDAGRLGDGAIWYVAELHLSGRGPTGQISIDGVQGAVLVRNGSNWQYRLTTVTLRPKQ